MPPWNQTLGPVISRLGYYSLLVLSRPFDGGILLSSGLKPDTTKEQFLDRLTRFGVDDSMYGLLNVYRVIPSLLRLRFELTIV